MDTLTNTEKIPSLSTLVNAAKLAIQKDMPIELNYFIDSAEGTAFLGEDAQTNKKVLVKNTEEYTSNIQKIYKAGDDFIVITENSIYIVSGKLHKRRIQISSDMEISNVAVTNTEHPPRGGVLASPSDAAPTGGGGVYTLRGSVIGAGCTAT